MVRRFAKQLCALFVIIAILLIRLRTYRDHAGQELGVGRMSGQQALKCSEPLLRILAPWEQTQNIYVEPAGGRNGGFWNVDSRDRAGNSLAILTWDANVKELTTVTCYPPPQKIKSARLTAFAAGQRMRLWLVELGAAHDPQQWRPAHPIFPVGNLWRGSWAGEGRRINLGIDAHSGELLFAAIYHRS